MSAETSTWLNTRTLIGFTDQRGHAWHYRAADQGDEPNHYPGAVPIGDVDAACSAGTRPRPTCSPSTSPRTASSASPTRPVRPSSGRPRRFGRGRRRRNPRTLQGRATRPPVPEWLLGTVGGSSTTTCRSAPPACSRAARSPGCRSRCRTRSPPRKAWTSGRTCSPAPPTTAPSPPRSSGSSPTSSATTPCPPPSRETGQRVKVRHSRHSRHPAGRGPRGAGHRPHHRRRLRRPGRPARRHRPSPTGSGQRSSTPTLVLPPGASTRARTSVEKKRASLDRLWDHDARVSPWKNTAWGVVQAVNTYAHHEQTVRGIDPSRAQHAPRRRRHHRHPRPRPPSPPSARSWPEPWTSTGPSANSAARSPPSASRRSQA